MMTTTLDTQGYSIIGIDGTGVVDLSDTVTLVNGDFKGKQFELPSLEDMTEALSSIKDESIERIKFSADGGSKTAAEINTVIALSPAFKGKFKPGTLTATQTSNQGVLNQQLIAAMIYNKCLTEVLLNRKTVEDLKITVESEDEYTKYVSLGCNSIQGPNSQQATISFIPDNFTYSKK
jgi:hypothetical protein